MVEQPAKTEFDILYTKKYFLLVFLLKKTFLL